MKKIREFLESVGMEGNITPGGYYIYRYNRDYRRFISFKARAAKILRVYDEKYLYRGPMPTVKQLREILTLHKLI